MKTLPRSSSAALLLFLFLTTMSAQENDAARREGEALVRIDGAFGPQTNLQVGYTLIQNRQSVTPGQIFFQSGFEESWTFGAPPGWTGALTNSDSAWHRNDFNTGWTHPAGLGIDLGYVVSFMGGYSARFHTVNTQLFRRGFLITPTINLSAANDSVFVSFWWLNASGTDSLRIYVSTDGGTTFPLLVGFAGRTGGPWFQARGYIPGASATTKLKFEATSDAGVDDILLDEIVVYQKGPGYTGTLSLPGSFTSFTDAARRLSIFGASGAVTVNVAAGTYADSVTFPPIPGASAANTIRFVNSGGTVAVQRAGVPTASSATLGTTVQRTDDATISLWGADYLTFDGIGISDLSGSTNNEWGYYVRAFTPTDGANSNTIRNALIVMNTTNTATHGIRHHPFWAILAQSGASSENRYHNNDIRSCGFRGILLQGSAPYLDLNNEVASVSGGTARFFNMLATTGSANAIGVSGQSGVSIHHVDIDSMTATTGTVTAILLGTGTTSGDSVVNFNVYSNNIRRLVHTGASASNILSAIRVPGHANALRGRIYNNMVSNLRSNGTSANAIDALYHQGGPRTFVGWYYNTVFLNNSVIGANGGNVLLRFDAGTATVRNNVFVNKSAQNGTGKNYIYNRTGGAVIASHNALYIDTTLANLFVGFYTSDRKSLSAWQSASQDLDIQSLYEDPSFVNSTTLPYDLHVNPATPTGLESGGINIAGITTDFDGDVRVIGPATASMHVNPNSAPDIGADEYGGTPIDVIPPLIAYALLGNTHLPTNRSLAATITDAASGVDRRPGLKSRLYYKKNGGSDWTSRVVDSAGVNVGNVWTFTVNHSLIGGVTAGDTLYYYVAAADSGGNTATNPSGGSGTPPGNTPPVVPNFYKILPSLSGTLTVGSSGTFTTLKALFDSVNASIVTANIVANVISDLTESASAVLNAVSYGPSGPFIIQIRPSGGSRTISGDITGALIDFNGADYVSIDGVGKTLTLSNINVGGQTVVFRNDATYDTVKSCVVRGVNTSLTSGSIVLSTSTAPSGGATGNRSISIQGNDVRDGATVPANAIYSSGSAAPALNGFISVTGNNVFNFASNGINVTSTGNGDGWTISGNSFFDQGIPSTAQTGIEFAPGASSNGNVISGNFVGGQAANAGGAPWTNSGAVTWRGIHVNCGAVAPTVVTNNTIQNILLNTTTRTVVTNSFYGIHAEFGTLTVTGNTIGHPTTANSIVSTVAGIMGGIRTTASATAAPWPTVNISGNTIANIVQTSDTNSVLHTIRGIEAGASSVTFIVNNNTLHDLYTASRNPNIQGGGATLLGIILSSGSVGTANPGNATCSGNTIYTLAATKADSSRLNVVGIAINLNMGEVTKNRIYDLRNASLRDNPGITPPTCMGIYLRTSEAPATPDGIVVCSNNIIELGSGQNTNTQFLGFWSNFTLAGNGKFHLYHNSVSISGTAASGANPTYCFLRGDTIATIARNWTVLARNNIFSNVRSGGTGKHYAVANRGLSSGANWPPAAFDFNVLYAGNPATLAVWDTTDRTFADWRTASAGDSNSVNSNPQFLSLSDLHINTSATTPSPAANRGFPVGGLTGFIADDFDGDSRNRATPDIGADEFTLRRPGTFVLQSPANGSTGQPLTGTLTWRKPTGASFFDVFFGTTNPPTTLVRSNQADTTYGYSVSLERTTFYWNIVGKNVDSTRSSTNGPFNFTTVTPAFSVSRRALNFGNVAVGGSKRDSVTATNNGTSTLTVSSVASTNARFSVTPTSAIIFPSESTKFYITFSPTAAGNQTGSVVFSHNAATSPDTVTVTGTGGPPPPAEAIADHATSAMRVSVTNEGNIGWLNAFPPAGLGNGFMFNPVTAAGQRLYEGAIMVGLDSTRVSDAARTQAQVFDADFKFLSNLDSSTSAGIRRVITTSYTDSLAETPFGVRVNQRTVSWDSAGINNFLIVELDLVNTSATAWTSLFAGGFFDWDVDPAAGADRGSVVVDSTNTIPGVNGGNPFGFDVMELHQGTAPNSWMGVVPLNDSRFRGRRVAISSSEVYPPYMTNGDKWRYMISNRVTNPNGDGGTTQDHAQVFGLGSYSVPAAGTKRIGFALVGGTSLANAVNAARTAQRFWFQRLGNTISIVTSVKDPVAGIPKSFELAQNYPNPFNPTTTLQYALPVQANVSLTIYNTLGQEIVRLVDGEVPPGYHTVAWNGRNEFGSQVASGVYFYRIEAQSNKSKDAFTSVKRMILLK